MAARRSLRRTDAADMIVAFGSGMAFFDHWPYQGPIFSEEPAPVFSDRLRSAAAAAEARHGALVAIRSTNAAPAVGTGIDPGAPKGGVAMSWCTAAGGAGGASPPLIRVWISRTRSSGLQP